MSKAHERFQKRYPTPAAPKPETERVRKGLDFSHQSGIQRHRQHWRPSSRGRENETMTAIQSKPSGVHKQGICHAHPEQADSGAAAHQQPRPPRLLAGPDRRRRCRRCRNRRPRVLSSGAGDGRAAGRRRGHQLGCCCRFAFQEKGCRSVVGVLFAYSVGTFTRYRWYNERVPID